MVDVGDVGDVGDEEKERKIYGLTMCRAPGGLPKGKDGKRRAVASQIC